jgi:hypothetical protein
MTEAEARAYTRGYDIATSRAESRRRLGLPIERTDQACAACARVARNEIETDR